MPGQKGGGRSSAQGRAQRDSQGRGRADKGAVHYDAAPGMGDHGAAQEGLSQPSHGQEPRHRTPGGRAHPAQQAATARADERSSPPPREQHGAPGPPHAPPDPGGMPYGYIPVSQLGEQYAYLAADDKGYEAGEEYEHQSYCDPYPPTDTSQYISSTSESAFHTVNQLSSSSSASTPVLASAVLTAPQLTSAGRGTVSGGGGPGSAAGSTGPKPYRQGKTLHALARAAFPGQSADQRLRRAVALRLTALARQVPPPTQLDQQRAVPAVSLVDLCGVPGVPSALRMLGVDARQMLAAPHDEHNPAVAAAVRIIRATLTDSKCHGVFIIHIAPPMVGLNVEALHRAATHAAELAARAVWPGDSVDAVLCRNISVQMASMCAGPGGPRSCALPTLVQTLPPLAALSMEAVAAKIVGMCGENVTGVSRGCFSLWALQGSDVVKLSLARLLNAAEQQEGGPNPSATEYYETYCFRSTPNNGPTPVVLLHGNPNNSSSGAGAGAAAGTMHMHTAWQAPGGDCDLAADGGPSSRGSLSSLGQGMGMSMSLTGPAYLSHAYIMPPPSSSHLGAYPNGGAPSSSVGAAAAAAASATGGVGASAGYGIAPAQQAYQLHPHHPHHHGAAASAGVSASVGAGARLTVNTTTTAATTTAAAATSSAATHECLFYKQNGWCAYGESCRYMHPPGVVVPTAPPTGAGAASVTTASAAPARTAPAPVPAAAAVSAVVHLSGSSQGAGFGGPHAVIGSGVSGLHDVGKHVRAASWGDPTLLAAATGPTATPSPPSAAAAAVASGPRYGSHTSVAQYQIQQDQIGGGGGTFGAHQHGANVPVLQPLAGSSSTPAAAAGVAAGAMAQMMLSTGSSSSSPRQSQQVYQMPTHAAAHLGAHYGAPTLGPPLASAASAGASAGGGGPPPQAHSLQPPHPMAPPPPAVAPPMAAAHHPSGPDDTITMNAAEPNVAISILSKPLSPEFMDMLSHAYAARQVAVAAKLHPATSSVCLLQLFVPAVVQAQSQHQQATGSSSLPGAASGSGGAGGGGGGQPGSGRNDAMIASAALGAGAVGGLRRSWEATTYLLDPITASSAPGLHVYGGGGGGLGGPGGASGGGSGGSVGSGAELLMLGLGPLMSDSSVTKIMASSSRILPALHAACRAHIRPVYDVDVVSGMVRALNPASSSAAENGVHPMQAIPLHVMLSETGLMAPQQCGVLAADCGDARAWCVRPLPGVLCEQASAEVSLLPRLWQALHGALTDLPVQVSQEQADGLQQQQSPSPQQHQQQQGHAP